ncbi:hypothetical protein A2331_05680 [Candidatus Falkowbacteria bacterium RIFOXYB2_FULL_34_18]|uniref:Xylose isomerase-like TIM barrel domain-containing protein n=1 Tax=Candidatus Falkowbacteria bacterium RIFOXYD2_FULL_34_120 TaxID=1798007 RepID=A0A1F5TQY6_9BACT|nr:MAG: hypothetical protein A2331_05680 [Candidatus Falkowbacteria bacterium RIFOXYB2_FULL_34_18]OGF29801.1 MAG: hypothetical protein A2500_01350 [Candidatus Falkowbacteria bacterium RIFOXYC12_FULL_34_55]OGF37084.1 MAG: hypothetical protein A2466_05855 [Candidatus Falkowbacteria bacterium RIFOXYC2_FULL_34_220]OGF39276.1 MAG: hypothetical protein A2515_01065 [Candidatus Falkowbacteria bacterium RIFOXYD12_FULL_34_57]OGF41380.1 MAG: hypothetical protein A2531_07270 [Candidatus Falkowbacteria bact
MITIGLTTGFLYNHLLPCNKQEKPVSHEMIKRCSNLGCNAIEFNCIGGFYDTSLADLKRIQRKDLLNFKHVSVHAPCREARFDNSKKVREILYLLETESRRLGIDLVVFHPDTVDDWNIFQDFNIPMAIENLDNNKRAFKAVADIGKIFKLLPKCRFVLDVNHCKANDPSMGLAQDFIDSFKDRIVEIHVSGFRVYHYPIYKTKQTEILDAIHNPNLPMIIESACKSEQDAKNEIEYIKSYFQKHI